MIKQGNQSLFSDFIKEDEGLRLPHHEGTDGKPELDSVMM